MVNRSTSFVESYQCNKDIQCLYSELSARCTRPLFYSEKVLVTDDMHSPLNIFYTHVHCMNMNTRRPGDLIFGPPQIVKETVSANEVVPSPYQWPPPEEVKSRREQEANSSGITTTEWSRRVYIPQL